MTTRVMATVVNGMLKPDECVPLPDQTRVSLTIETLPEPSQAAAAWQALKERIRQRPIHAEGLRYTRDELHERC
jgi:hypothetical protein